jgi:hypothetical protein
MDQNILATMGPLCPSEVTAMGTATNGRAPIALYPGPGLFDDVVAAADMWSLAVGRPVFTVH